MKLSHFLKEAESIFNLDPIAEPFSVPVAPILPPEPHPSDPAWAKDHTPFDTPTSDQLQAGKLVEMEHENTYNMIANMFEMSGVHFPITLEQFVTSISQDHLVEIPDYYARLKKMEDEAKGVTPPETTSQEIVMPIDISNDPECGCSMYESNNRISLRAK